MIRMKLAFSLFACAMMLIASTSVAAQESDQEDEKKVEKTDPRLHFQIIPQKTVLIPGEPLKIRCILTNRSSQVVVTSEMIIGREDVLIWVSHEDGPFLSYRGGWHLDVFGDRVNLKPGASLQAEALVQYNYVSKGSSEIINTYFAFPESGTYTIKAKINCGTTEAVYVHAEPVRIRVKELQGVDAEVWKLIKDDADVAYFISADGRAFVESEGFPKRARGKKVVETLTEILSKYPNSSYSPYFKSALSNYENRLVDWRKGRAEFVQGALSQAGYYLQKGDMEYGLGMIPQAKKVAEEINLFPKDLPQEPYIGLAYLFNKNYSKALEYLEPSIAIGQPGADNRALIEAAAFALLASGKQDRAAELLKTTRSDQEQAQMMSLFRDRIQKRQPFTLEIYH